MEFQTEAGKVSIAVQSKLKAYRFLLSNVKCASPVYYILVFYFCSK